MGSEIQSQTAILCRRVAAFLVDETMMQIRSDQAWLWVAVVEPVHRQIL
jgi:transposase-like protein